MRRIPAGIIVWSLVLSAAPAWAQSVTVTVSAKTNIALAGQPDGLLLTGGDSSPANSPVLVPSAVTAGQVVQIGASGFVDVTSDTGSGTVSYAVTAKTGTSSRTGTLTIAALTFTVSQAAPATVVAVAGVSGSAATGSSSVRHFRPG